MRLALGAAIDALASEITTVLHPHFVWCSSLGAKKRLLTRMKLEARIAWTVEINIYLAYLHHTHIHVVTVREMSHMGVKGLQN